MITITEATSNTYKIIVNASREIEADEIFYADEPNADLVYTLEGPNYEFSEEGLNEYMNFSADIEDNDIKIDKITIDGDVEEDTGANGYIEITFELSASKPFDLKEHLPWICNSAIEYVVDHMYISIVGDYTGYRDAFDPSTRYGHTEEKYSMEVDETCSVALLGTDDSLEYKIVKSTFPQDGSIKECLLPTETDITIPVFGIYSNTVDNITEPSSYINTLYKYKNSSYCVSKYTENDNKFPGVIKITVECTENNPDCYCAIKNPNSKVYRVYKNGMLKGCLDAPNTVDAIRALHKATEKIKTAAEECL